MLLTVENLSLTFDKKQIFNNASFRVLPNEKIGVVGNNGVGKTTLINVLCGKIIPDSGKIDFDKKIKVGYLDQYININPNVSINNYLKQAFLGLYEKDEEMNRMFDELSKTDDEIIINRYVRLTTQIREYLESNDFYAIDSKIGRIVSGLGIVQYGLDTLVGRLSGGQKVKVALAKLLLEEPDLLILDEPTAHLDLESITSLNNGLIKYDSELLFASHDHQFVSTIANRIIEILPTGVIDRRLPYDEYLENKEVIKLREQANK